MNSNMDELTQSIIFNIERSFALMAKSIYNFRRSLMEKEALECEKFYYFAIYPYKEEQVYYKRALAIARGAAPLCKRLVIPAEKISEWKSKLSKVDNPIVAKNKLLEYLQAELEKDRILRRWIGKEEIRYFVKKYFKEQLQGKRDLSNIKLRILLADVERVLQHTKKLKEEAQRHWEKMLNSKK